MDSSTTGELHLKATFYVYVVRLRSTLLKLSIDLDSDAARDAPRVSGGRRLHCATRPDGP